MTGITWTLHRQQQQCGAQLPSKARQAGEVPAEAVAGREAQDHEQAGGVPQAGESPASALENRRSDPSSGLRTGNTPSASEAQVQWDEVVQPERRQLGELYDDGRGDDAEQVADPQAEQALREAAMERDADELDEDGRFDRND